MRFFISLLLSLVIISCEDDKKLNACGCDSTSTIDDVEWLLELKQSITNCSCEMSIIKGTYHSQTVFFIAVTDPLCNSIDTPTLYNCMGLEVKTFTASEPDQKNLRDNVTRDTVLYRCKD